MEGEASAFILTICNTLSMTVVGLCVVMKVPQIWSAFNKGDTRGISLSSVLLEQCGYSIMLSYSFAMDYPVANYLETAFLVLQNFVMLGLIIHTRNMLSPSVFVTFVIYMVVYLSIGNRMVPDFVLMSVMSLGTPLSVSSKVTQIVDLYKRKDPGRLSMLTWGIAAYGCYGTKVLIDLIYHGGGILLRIFTNLVQTGDIFIITNFVSGATLNTVMVAMIYYYTQQAKSKLY